ncbi:HopJ type III effector protein [Marinobacter bohaiensis]|uniref:HopJ type III effector protein n=1 Tax=Marinobacter bohaiensis TaxID=2201898 RepID=UPI000DADC553|nr:HopJ type III effector protein [Marinobacter bohaiensis]
MDFQNALRIHLAALDAGRSDFEDSLELIERFFEFMPTAFDNGPVHNAAGSNNGSCRIFALGQLAGLGEQATLDCFGRHYRSVMADPSGSDHANIRQFMSTGWSGIRFDGRPLVFRAETEAGHTSDPIPSPTNNGESR